MWTDPSLLAARPVRDTGAFPVSAVAKLCVTDAMWTRCSLQSGRRPGKKLLAVCNVHACSYQTDSTRGCCHKLCSVMVKPPRLVASGPQCSRPNKCSFFKENLGISGTFRWLSRRSHQVPHLPDAMRAPDLFLEPPYRQT